MILLNAQISKETEKAVLVSMFAGADITFWMPKSQVSNIDVEGKKITCANWLIKNVLEAYMKVERESLIGAIS